MSNAELNKITDVVTEVVEKILEENNKNKTLDKSNEIKDNQKELTKEERLKGIYNQLNEEEIPLFKKLSDVNSESLDNAYSDSLGNHNFLQHDEYKEMAKEFPDERVKEIEKLFEENIHKGIDDIPNNEIRFSEIRYIEKNIENEMPKEERLKGIYNQLNKEEIPLFKKLSDVNSESLDNAYSDSFGNKKYVQRDEYKEMAKEFPDERVKEIEKLFKENIHKGIDATPENKIGYAEIDEIEKNIENQEITPEDTTKNIKKELENHSEDINKFIDNEVTNESEMTSYLTENELNSLLNDHFKRIEDVLHEYEGNNIDADTFKGKLNDLTNHVKENARSSFKKVINKTTKPIKNLKNNARDRIDSFMNKMNDKLKNISHKIDSRNKENEVSVENNLSSEKKIEKTLRNNPELFKQALAVTQINSMKNHLEESKYNLEKLSEMNHDDPTQKIKIDDMKLKLHTHIDGMEKELNNLEQSHNPEKTIINLNEQSQDIKEEKNEEKENNIEKKPAKEKVLER